MVQEGGKTRALVHAGRAELQHVGQGVCPFERQVRGLGLEAAHRLGVFGGDHQLDEGPLPRPGGVRVGVPRPRVQVEAPDERPQQVVGTERACLVQAVQKEVRPVRGERGPQQLVPKFGLQGVPGAQVLALPVDRRPVLQDERERDRTTGEETVTLERAAHRVERAARGRDEGDGAFVRQDFHVGGVDAALVVNEGAVEVQADDWERRGRRGTHLLRQDLGDRVQDAGGAV